MTRTIVNFAAFALTLITWATLVITGHPDPQLQSVLAMILGGAVTSHVLQIHAPIVATHEKPSSQSSEITK